MNYKSPDNTKISGFSLHEIDAEFASFLPAGSVEITQLEASAIRTANIPPIDPKLAALARIRAKEQSIADDQAKITRQSLLVLALDRACADPLAAGLTRDQVHTALMAAGTGYARMYIAEQEIAVDRALL